MTKTTTLVFSSDPVLTNRGELLGDVLPDVSSRKVFVVCMNDEPLGICLYCTLVDAYITYRINCPTRCYLLNSDQ